MTAFQLASSWITNPTHGIVVSITQFHADDAMNVLSDYAAHKGTARSFAEHAPTSIEPLIRGIVENTATAHRGTSILEYSHFYPVLINS